MRLVSKARTLFLESASRVHVSQPKRRMEVTRDFLSLNLFAKLILLHRQILFSVGITVIAEAILMRTSADDVPYLHRVAPNLNWSSACLHVKCFVEVYEVVEEFAVVL